MENYNLTPADVAMMTKHHDRSAMAATGIAANGCDKCSRTFVSETPISIAVA